MYNEFNDTLKELGDIRSWATAIENDLDSVLGACEYLTKTVRVPMPTM